MSEEKHETHAAVVAEMRNRTDVVGGDMVDNFSLDATFGEYGGYDPLPLIKAYADRAEDAHKRELAIKDAVIQSESAARLAEQERHKREIAELKKQIGNAAKLREVATAENSSVVGNVAKLLEALDEIIKEIAKWRAEGMMEYWQYSQLFDIADRALSEPARNCDLHCTEKEARAAFLSEKCPHPCGNCNVGIGEDALQHRCGLDWLFAIPKKGDGNGVK